MNVKLQNKHVYQGVQLVGKFAERDVPFKISYACGKSLVRLREQFQLIEAERQKIIKKHQKKDGDGTLMTKKANNELGQEIDVPDCDDSVEEDLQALQDLDVEIDVYCLTIDVWNEHMQANKCKECKRGKIDVSSNEMAALIRLGILVDGDDAS